MNIRELYIKTIFCCMACDGDIAKEEIALVKDITFKNEIFFNLDVEGLINEYVALINDNGVDFLNQYLNELSMQEMSEIEQMQIVSFAIDTIRADNKIEYSEVKFFKKIRKQLSLSDEQILSKYPDVEDFLLPDINVDDKLFWNDIVFDKVSFDNIDI